MSQSVKHLHLAQKSDFDTENANDGKTELNPATCPLTFVCKPWNIWMHTHK